MRAKTIMSMEQLIDALDPHCKDVEAYTGAMDAIGFKSIDIGQFLHFGDDFYTRNLVTRNRNYELLVLCWGSQQVSPIHNHELQDCWMCIIEGTLEERLYHPMDNGDGTVCLRRGDVRSYGVGSSGHIRDDMAIHSLGNVNGNRAISIHLYSLPFSSVKIYPEEGGVVQEQKLGYHSVEGELTRDGKSGTSTSMA